MFILGVYMFTLKYVLTLVHMYRLVLLNMQSPLGPKDLSHTRQLSLVTPLETLLKTLPAHLSTFSSNSWLWSPSSLLPSLLSMVAYSSSFSKLPVQRKGTRGGCVHTVVHIYQLCSPLLLFHHFHQHFALGSILFPYPC